MDKINKAILLQNKGAVTGAAWAEFSMIGYTILYPQLGGYTLLYSTSCCSFSFRS
ncbi:MAG: hypothetical protein ACE5HY_04925 [Candidatus Hydrothermarchaeales archaeon]